MAKAEKVFKAGIQRDNDLMYYLKGGDIWAVPRKKPGAPKGKARVIVTAGVQADYANFLYFIDADGDVARKERHVGGAKGPRKARRVKPVKTVKAKLATKKPATKKPTAKAKPGGIRSGW